MSLADTLRQSIMADGPMRLDAWMTACNGHYYASRDPFGAAGDFTTAPEISQMFGEIIGGWIGDIWTRAGAPAVHLVELGPGRGTLMADALRVLGRLPGFAETATLHLVETSPVLRAAQAQTLVASPLAPHWHDDLEAIPDTAPLIVVANEFFDALPVRQRKAAAELHIGVTDDGFAPVWIASAGPDREWSPAGEALAAQIGARLDRHGGAALVIDYGHDGSRTDEGLDSLQGLRHHMSHDPFIDPGEADLTAHVDFGALAATAGVPAHGPMPQGVLLTRLGIEPRAEKLKAGRDTAAAARVSAALVRLTAPVQMGALFKVLAFQGRGWPQPAGFSE
ncbi:SAM-dependent methyltransferase [Sandarakinorhabdus sp.]|uniref:class I SAM-dependent methyltransferase n=1 Tax=Sandarakinorhabdus sp. TaxID=1916663 RepID=UPI00286E860A|nr:SAM-dependent methyltransferase [Sandarakinorhabdus sp.]